MNNTTNNLTQRIEDMIERTKMDLDYATEQITYDLTVMERYIELAREALAKDNAAPLGYDPEAIGRRIEDAMQDRERNAQQIVKYEALLKAAR